MWYKPQRGRFDPGGAQLADRHYNRRKVGSPQFVPPGRCVVLRAPGAVWVTSWPYAQWVKHQWGGAWVNSLFRRESGPLASEMIRAAVAATLSIWPEPPTLGIVSFIDANKVKPKQTPGYCYLMAGWHHVGFTKAGLWVYQQLPEEMPWPEAVLNEQSA